MVEPTLVQGPRRKMQQHSCQYLRRHHSQWLTRPHRPAPPRCFCGEWEEEVEEALEATLAQTTSASS